MLIPTSNRVKWIDYAKCILIFFMVSGHCNINNTYHMFIYSFHMPAFFIISGYLFKIKEEKAFDSIFIGGSGGSLEKIIDMCNKLLIENGTIVMNFITLDNAYKAIEVMKKLNYIIDISQVNISKNRGKSYMMIANNPIYIVQCVRSVK